MENLHDGPRSGPDQQDYVRIRFQLEQDEDGYPNIGAETVWARVVDRGYEVDNIPFYAYGVSCHDIVDAMQTEAKIFEFKTVLEVSGHSTIRVILREHSLDVRPVRERTDDLRRSLVQIGCDTEAARPGFISVDIPPRVGLPVVREVLDPGEKSGLWSYEEATLRHES